MVILRLNLVMVVVIKPHFLNLSPNPIGLVKTHHTVGIRSYFLTKIRVDITVIKTSSGRLLKLKFHSVSAGAMVMVMRIRNVLHGKIEIIVMKIGMGFLGSGGNEWRRKGRQSNRNMGDSMRKGIL